MDQPLHLGFVQEEVPVPPEVRQLQRAIGHEKQTSIAWWLSHPGKNITSGAVGSL
jgi:hypothetical protein